MGECNDKPGGLTVAARISRSLQTPRNLPLSPVSPNSTKSFRMRSAGVANICTASLFMERPTGSLVLAALSSGTMP